MQYRDANQQAWDRLVQQKTLFANVATDEECRNPLLTLDTRGWLPGSVIGMDVLCLGAGGGWQSILYAVAGAKVTVVDLSLEMLAQDLREAKKRHVTVRTIHASMDDLKMLTEESFDIVHQPVSTCYVPRVAPVYCEVGRVLRDRGLYISQHKAPTSLQVVDRDSHNRYTIGIPYYHADPLPAVQDTAYREGGTVEYLHRWEQLVGDLCKAGFVIEDLVEPRRGDPKALPGNFRHRGMYIAPYVRIKARRLRQQLQPPETETIWVPGV